MTLLLTIVNNPNENIEFRSFQLNEEDGLIGRDDSCSWKLADSQKIISNRHAKIKYKQGEYFIIDISRNGIFNNTNGRKLPKDERVQLKKGDILSIGEYRIEVNLKGETRPIYKNEEEINTNNLNSAVLIISGGAELEENSDFWSTPKRDIPLEEDKVFSDDMEDIFFSNNIDENLFLSIFSRKLNIDFNKMTQDEQIKIISQLADIISVNIKNIENLKNSLKI